MESENFYGLDKQDESFAGDFYGKEWEDCEFKPNFWLDIRFAVSDAKYAVKNFAYDARYSWKNFFAVLSGFSHLEHRRKVFAIPENYFEVIRAHTNAEIVHVEKYYSLCVFNNGAKVPYPIVLGECAVGTMQVFFMKLADKISGGFSAAKKACEYFAFLFEEAEKNYYASPICDDEEGEYISQETLERLRAIKFAEDGELFED